MIKYVKRLMEPSSHGGRGTSILVRSTGDSIELPDVPPDELPTDPPPVEVPTPPPEIIPDPNVAEVYIFSVETYLSTKSNIYIYLRHVNPSQWVIKDRATGVILADYTGFANNNITVSLPVGATNQGIITISQSGNSVITYELSGTVDKAFIEYYGVGKYQNTPPDPVEGRLTVIQYSTNIAAYGFSVSLLELTVPSTLPVHVTDLSHMFFGCHVFNQDISGLDTSNVTNMRNTFGYCPSFNQDIGGWNTANVTDMSYMFYGCSVFNQDLSRWDVGKVVDMNSMFDSCGKFNQSIGSWNTSNVVTMSYMFNRCGEFNQPIGSWNITKVNTTAGMFQLCRAFNQNLSGWDTSNILDMSYMFNYATNFNQDLSSWNVLNISYEPEYFSGSVSSWTQSKPSWGGGGTV